MEKQLAIMGHQTMGKEVIDILQMLGGKKTTYGGEGIYNIYYLDDSGNIISEYYLKTYVTDLAFEVFTLEEFLEKYPYKVGNKVTSTDYSGYGFITKMVWDSVDWCVKYCVKFEDFGTIAWFNSDEIKISDIRCHTDCTLYTDPLHELCENMCENKLSTLMIDSEVCGDEVEIILNDYEIEIRDGKTYAIKKKPKYPTTYEECCGILGMTFDYPDIRMVSNDEYNLYSSFIQLIRCRDAYWKIAGEEMGLGKPWDATYGCGEWGYWLGYSIIENKIFLQDSRILVNHTWVFPSAEMRDTFYENFKDLIEKCKTLL